MADIKGKLSIDSNLLGRLDGCGYTLPIATATRLGCVKTGEGLKTNADGILRVLYNSDKGLFFDDNGYLCVKIGQGLYYDANGKICVNDEFDISKLRDDINRLDINIANLMDFISDMYVSQNTYISLHIYEVITDDNGYATLSVVKDGQIASVFINGIFAVADKDYQIIDGSIQITNTEFTPGNDAVSIVVFKSIIDSNTNNTIGVSSEIYEVETDSDGYAQFPFTYNNQMFYVFINGVLAGKKDYQIINGSILLTDSEFLFGNDIVTFVVLKPLINGVENKSINLSLKTYDAETDNNSRAIIPLVPQIVLKNNNSSAVQVYVNGLFSVEGKDYQIEDGSIQLTSSEALSGNDVITFVIFEAKVDENNRGSSADDVTFISNAEIDEIINI